MANGKDPAFPLYAADFLLDSRVTLLDLADQAVLVRLWSVLWLNGPLPMDSIRRFAPQCCTDAEHLERIAREFLVEREDGSWHSVRLEKERADREALRAKRSEAGKKGARAKGSASKATSKRQAKPPANGQANGEHRADDLPPAPNQPPAPAPSSGTPQSPPRGGGVSSAPSEDADPPLSAEDAAEESTIDEMVPVCRDAGVRMARFPLRRLLRGFVRAEGDPETLRGLAELAASASDPPALLVHWLEDPYRWKSARDDRDAAAKHEAALKRSRESSEEDDYRTENGLQPVQQDTTGALTGATTTKEEP